MSRRLTQSEALDLIDAIWEAEPDMASGNLVEVFVGDTDLGSANADLESYLSIIAADIDPDTISITPDVVEGTSLSAVKITIKTEN